MMVSLPRRQRKNPEAEPYRDGQDIPDLLGDASRRRIGVGGPALSDER